MSVFDDFAFSAKDFSGTTRVFPLPNLVLFPHVMQPLHIFEPRYRELLEEALAGDRLMTVATLQPGWETDYEGRPPLYDMACLGRIAAHHRLEDGASNILLYGVSRVQLVRELPPRRSFREAEVRLCGDACPAADATCGPSLQRRLREVFLQLLPRLPQAQEQLDQVLGSDLSLGALTDIIGYLLDLPIGEKEALLAETNVRRRAERLLALLAAGAAGALSSSSDFLPGFSPN